MPEAKPWDETFARIRGVYWPECVYPPRETPASLDAAEQDLGFSFPLSYRAFAEQFGLDGLLRCSLPRVLPLRPPPGANEEDWDRSVLAATRFHRTFDWSEYYPDTPAEFFRGLIVFAIDGGYHTWAFDVTEITDTSPLEYEIIEIPRHEEPFRVATTFPGWLEHIDVAYKFDDEEVDEDPSVPPVYKPDSSVADPMPYLRDWDRRKETPDESSVRHWLVWNHGTVLALARAIRDGGTNAWPVLADALEDAGCAHSDLLASCRLGDPDIDGIWALRILLDSKGPTQ